jgi:hypothetical protein
MGFCYCDGIPNPMSLQGQILIADDHPLFRMALKQAVTQAFPRTSVVEA